MFLFIYLINQDIWVWIFVLVLKKLLQSVYPRQVDTCDFSVTDCKVKSCKEIFEDMRQDGFLAMEMEASLVTGILSLVLLLVYLSKSFCHPMSSVCASVLSIRWEKSNETVSFVNKAGISEWKVAKPAKRYGCQEGRRPSIQRQEFSYVFIMWIFQLKNNTLGSFHSIYDLRVHFLLNSSSVKILVAVAASYVCWDISSEMK